MLVLSRPDASSMFHHELVSQTASLFARPHPGAFELVRNEIERVVEVSDDVVEAAMRAYFRATHNVAEGAGAAALAGVFQEHPQIAAKRVAAVLTGGNVDSDVYCRVLTAGSEGQP